MIYGVTLRDDIILNQLVMNTTDIRSFERQGTTGRDIMDLMFRCRIRTAADVAYAKAVRDAQEQTVATVSNKQA